MKWIFGLLLLCSLNCFSQEDTSRYQRYATTYGMQVPRIWVTKILRLPDTINNINALPGAIAYHAGVVYTWNGSAWAAVSGSGGSYTPGNGILISSGVIKSDTSSASGNRPMATLAAVQKRIDSLKGVIAGLYVPISGYNLQTVTNGTGHNVTGNGIVIRKKDTGYDTAFSVIDSATGLALLSISENADRQAQIDFFDYEGNFQAGFSPDYFSTRSLDLRQNVTGFLASIKSNLISETRYFEVPNASGTIPLSVKINGTTHYPNDTGNIDLGSISGGGNGTVTTLSVTTANGISGTVANATTTPAITLSLGAITPSSVTASGDIEITDYTKGIILKTSDGTRARITLKKDGGGNLYLDISDPL